MKTDLKWYL